MIVALISGCSRDRVKHLSASEKAQFMKEHNLRRMPKFDIPIEINGRVVAWLEYFQGPGKKHYRRYLKRSGTYEIPMKAILKSNGLPEDLFYLALIESGFNNHARSRAGAVGPWQFMPYTGKHYGLKVSSWLDERRDPIKSTQAAVRYLKKLYIDFQDWNLAMAAYNAGEGKVGRAIKKTGSRNFWEIAKHRKALRPETRDYVPKFMAAAIIAKMPDQFGFGDVELNETLGYDVVKVNSQTDFKVLAKCAGASESEIHTLNAHYYRKITPPGNSFVRIPVGQKETFQVKLAKIPKSERVTIVYHRVKRRETLSQISRKYGVRTSDIVYMNKLKSKHRIYPGQKLVIPMSKGARKYYAKKRTSKMSHSNKYYRYKIKSGETLGGIANRHGVSVSNLRRWNNLNRRSKIIAGKKLKIYKANKNGAISSSGVHTVTRGDTIYSIAKQYKISSKQIMALNDISNPKKIQIGQKLKLSNRVAKTSSSKTKAKTKPITNGKTVKYKLKSGESLYLVAKKYGVSTKELMAWNNIKNPRRLRPGKILIIKTSKKDTLPQLNKNTNKKTSSPSANVITYLIKPGDTLWNVARKHNVTIAELKKWNGLNNPRSLRPGDKISIHNP